ncbi:energy transducer TonB family protein [Novosphingobium sediminicola]|uniref:TonB family protein n=1 Tax=Novosphingobium sediminicola TaxID=563162 RepID=A0A7W6G8X9_9SPHN|nr:energy transducer TonB [Novosphingobium sediminicola]MBB3957868.1 TonB family protein [Novosphingobium sediminicola]
MKQKWAITRLAALAGALSTATGAAAQELPPLEPILLNSSAVTCIKIADDGSVSDAFIVVSSGLPERDRHVLAWVRQLHWDAALPGDRFRNRWFPMPVAFGNAKPPEMPEHCPPDDKPRQTS